MGKIKRLAKLAFLLGLAAFLVCGQAFAAPKNNSGRILPNKKILASKDFQIDSDGALVHYSGSSKDVAVPSGVKSICFGAFMDHPEIESITIPEGVITIEECAFYGCSALKNIHLPESAVRIERLAFGGCTSLEKIYMGENMREIAELFVCDCPNLSAFEVSEKNENFTVADGILYSKDMKNLILCPQNTHETISIPDDVVTIKEQSFFECANLKEINIGKNVKYIDEAAFYGCKSLKKVNMGPSVKKIRPYAFAECPAIEEFDVGKNVTQIGNGAFYNCNNLSKFTCLNKKIEFGSNVFTEGLNVTLYVSDDSDAYRYAVDNKYNFEII